MYTSAVCQRRDSAVDVRVTVGQSLSALAGVLDSNRVRSRVEIAVGWLDGGRVRGY